MTHKIRTKLLIGMLIIGIVASIPITFISMSSLINSSVKQAKDFGEKSAYYNSEIINTWLAEKSDVLMGLKVHLDTCTNKSEIKNLLKVYSDINSDFISIFIGYDDNELLDAYGWKPDVSYKVAERPWYQKAVHTDRYVTTSVYEDANKRENVIAIASGITLKGKTGVIAANIFVNYILEIIDSIKYGEHGFAVLLDDNYNLITGPKSPEDMEVFDEVFKKVAGGLPQASQAVEIEVDGETYIAAYSNVQDFDWNLFLIAPLSDFMEPAYEVKRQMFYMLAVILFIIMLLDYYLSRSISKPIEDLVRCISRIAGGDFNTEVNIQSQDEIGVLSKELEKMRLNLKKIFESLKYESKIIAMNSQTLSQHLNDTYKGTSRFISMLSHDIKTPITLIKGYSKAISTGMVEAQKTTEYVERIHYRSEQIESILSDTLDNACEANDVRVSLKMIRVVDYINMILYNSENYVENQNRKFIQKIQCETMDLQAIVAVDLTKIQRVVNNLLSNAVKFSEEGSIIELLISRDGDKLQTCFRDYGIGISGEEQERVFNMFYKGDDNKKGYGLGLYISKAIIEAHGGEISFSSEEGVGTSAGYWLQIEKIH